jgi:hypothetical protein
MRRAPEPGPVRGDRVELSDLHLYAPSPSLRGTRGEVSTTPIDRVADSSSSCYQVIQVDAHARLIGVGSWSGDSSMKALARVC